MHAIAGRVILRRVPQARVTQHVLAQRAVELGNRFVVGRRRDSIGADQPLVVDERSDPRGVLTLVEHDRLYREQARVAGSHPQIVFARGEGGVEVAAL